MTKLGVTISFVLGVLALIGTPWVDTLPFYQIILPFFVGVGIELVLVVLLALGVAVKESRR